MFLNALALMATLAFAPVQEAAPSEPVTEQAPPAEPAVVPETPVAPIPEITEDELVIGEANAAETIVVYSALVCTQCAAWHTEGLPQLIAQTVATGEVRVVTRFVPADERTAVAAAIVRCSVKENQMNVAGAFFENQASLLDGSMTELDWHLAGVAVSGRTREEITACLAEPSTFEAVSQTLTTAIAAGVEGVPAFFINGVPASGVSGAELPAQTSEPSSES